MALFRVKKLEILPQDEYKLKSVLGVTPRVYVPAAYGALAALALFLLFFLHGIVRPGSLVSFVSEPEGSAVYVDGAYVGKTPCDVFVSSGARSYSAVMAGFNEENAALDVKNRLFASLFFPKRAKVSFTLTKLDENNPLLEAAREFAAWSFTGEPTEIYQIPLVLSDGMYKNGAETSATLEILLAAARFARTKAALRDILRAYLLTDGNSPSPTAFLDKCAEAARLLSAHPEMAAWLSDALPKNAKNALTRSAWYEVSTKTEAEDAPSFKVSRDNVIVGGVNFVKITDALYAAVRPVSIEQYDRFLLDNPDWRLSNLDALLEQGLVTDDYLLQIDDSRFPHPAAGGVSFFAAEAYCAYLTKLLPSNIRGVVTLPTSSEWQALSAAYEAGAALQDVGRAWEWCRSPYTHYPFIRGGERFFDAVSSPEMTVWGANWSANKSVARGSAPPSSSSVFTLVRPVIVVGSNETPSLLQLD